MRFIEKGCEQRQRGLSIAYCRPNLLGVCRLLPHRVPAQRMVVKALDQRGFDHLEVRRHVKSRGKNQRRKKAVVAHMQDLIDAQGAQQVLRGAALDDRQDRVEHRLKHLGDQRRTNRPRRVATVQRQHAPPPTRPAARLLQ